MSHIGSERPQTSDQGTMAELQSDHSASYPAPKLEMGLYVLTIEEPGGTRYENAKRQADEIAANNSGLNVTIINGVHAGRTDVERYYDPGANRRHMKYTLSKPEIACYLSHRLAWNRFLDSAQPYALILEDDFVLNDAAMLSQVISELPRFDFRWDVIKLHDFTVRSAWRSRTYDGFEVRQATSPAACATAYLINRGSARKLMRGERPVYRQIDHDFKYYWETKTRIFTIVPNPIGEKGQDLGGSALEGSRQKIKADKSILDELRGTRLTLSRAVLNFFYRRIYTLDPPADQN